MLGTIFRENEWGTSEVKAGGRKFQEEGGEALVKENWGMDVQKEKTLSQKREKNVNKRVEKNKLGRYLQGAGSSQIQGTEKKGPEE